MNCRATFRFAVCLAGAFVLACSSSCRRRDAGVSLAAEPVAPAAGKPPREQDNSPPGPGAVVFDLRYRGVNPEDTHLFTGSATGWGAGDASDSKYLKRLRSKQEVRAVHNPNLLGREWCGLEMTNDKVAAFHIDVDGDQRPDADERLTPSVIPEGHYFSRQNTTVFFTPDMELLMQDGRRVPGRFLLRVNGAEDSCPMWSCASVWTAEADINDRPYRATLRAGSVVGGFRTFGRTSILLEQAGVATNSKPRPSWSPLSSIIRLDGGFKRLRFLGDESRADDFRLVLEPCTNATGRLAPRVVGSGGKTLESSFDYVRLVGESEPDVRFGLSVDKGGGVVPVGIYELSYARVAYSEVTNTRWTCQVSKYSGVEIVEDEICELSMGPPTLAVEAVDADRRYSSDTKPTTEFTRETTIYLSPKVSGPNGEEFSRFARAVNGKRKESPAPRLRIADADGSEVATAKLEYG